MAVGAAALVLALTLFAASPAAHDWLHAGDDEPPHETGSQAQLPADREAGCAVEMFASGISILVDQVPVAPARIFRSLPAPSGPDTLFLESPRFLHLPERGPPMMG